MKDPSRLLEGYTTPAERAMLENARDDGPSDAQLAAARAALGLAPIALVPPIEAAVTGTAKTVKLALAAAAITAGVSAGVVGYRSTEPIRPLPPMAPASVDVQVPKMIEAVELEPPAEVRMPPKRVRPRREAEAPVPPPPRPTLRDEMRLIQEARLAVEARDGPRALATLEAYDDMFETGTLREEADALYVEAAFITGDENAPVLAKRFLERHPTSPYAAAIRALSEAAP